MGTGGSAALASFLKNQKIVLKNVLAHTSVTNEQLTISHDDDDDDDDAVVFILSLLSETMVRHEKGLLLRIHATPITVST